VKSRIFEATVHLAARPLVVVRACGSCDRSLSIDCEQQYIQIMASNEPSIESLRRTNELLKAELAKLEEIAQVRLKLMASVFGSLRPTGLLMSTRAHLEPVPMFFALSMVICYADL